MSTKMRERISEQLTYIVEKVPAMVSKDASFSVVFNMCDGSKMQKWHLVDETGFIVHMATGLCLQFKEKGMRGDN